MMVDLIVTEKGNGFIKIDGQNVVQIDDVDGPDGDGMVFLRGTIIARVRDRISIGHPVRLLRHHLAPHYKMRSGVVACVGSSSGEGREYAMTVRLV